MLRHWNLLSGSLAMLALSACASYGTMLVNSNRQLVRCAATGGGGLGIAMANSSHDKCIDNYRSAGYLPLDEAGVTGVANVSSSDRVVRVLRVADNSPAARAGIAPGDVITTVNGQPVTTAKDAMLLMFGKAGGTVEIVLRRAGQDRAVRLLLDPYSKVYGTSASATK